MKFMMTSSNDDKSDICHFFLPRLILYCQYSTWTKFHVKWTNFFWDTSCFSTAGLLAAPPPQPWDFKKSPAQVGLKQKMFTSFKLSWKLKFTLSAPMSVLAWKALLKWYRPSNEPDCLLCNPLKLISTPD